MFILIVYFLDILKFIKDFESVISDQVFSVMSDYSVVKFLNK